MANNTVLLELCRPAVSRGWRVEAYVRAIAGLLVLASAALAFFVSPWWLLLAAFVGLNLIQSSLTGWCLLSNMLAMGVLRDAPHDGT